MKPLFLKTYEEFIDWKACDIKDCKNKPVDYCKGIMFCKLCNFEYKNILYLCQNHIYSKIICDTCRQQMESLFL